MQGELTGRRPFERTIRENARCIHAVTKPSHVRLEAISVMNELEIDISHHRSKSVDEFTSHADLGSRFIPAMDGELSGWMETYSASGASPPSVAVKHKAEIV
jgi:protein-tyrosine-phosphatase